jgi:DNA-binding HxlR family transcriptional regulator
MHCRGCENARMSAFGEFCPYNKAIEHLGDRWSLIIVKELAMHGSRGFNAIAGGLPGVSRSVLARRLRKLEELGLILRDPSVRASHAPYRLAPAGEQLVPTLLSLDSWAKRWVPEDPALVQRDPTVITFWLSRRIDPEQVPEMKAVIAFEIGGLGRQQQWLVVERGVPASICVEDPGLPQDRYVYVEAEAATLFLISRGTCNWSTALADGSVRLYGEPKLVKALPGWFRRGAPERDGVTGGQTLTSQIVTQPSVK